MTLAVGAVLVAFALPLCRRGIVLSDEGYLLLQGLDMLSGKVLYRDMDAFVSPGAWFLVAGLFGLVEPSVLASRIPALICYVATVWVSYRIIAGLANRRYGMAGVVVFMVFAVWAFPTWTFFFYSPFSVLFALAGLERLLSWQRTQRNRDLLWCGVLLGLSISFKQNYGVFALLGSLVGVFGFQLEAKQSIRDSLRALVAASARLGVGLAVVAVPLIAYFVYHGALGELVYSLVLHPFEFMGRHDIPYLGLSELWRPDPLEGVELLTYGATPLFHLPPPLPWLHTMRAVERLHVLLYWLPPLVFGFGLWAALRPTASARPIDAALLAVVAICGFVFLGVLPRADFNHLGNVYQPVIVTAAVVTHRLSERRSAAGSVGTRLIPALACLILALYGSVAAYWYHGLLTKMDTKVAGSRGGVLVGRLSAWLIDSQVKAIRAQTDEGEAVLTVPDLAMLNFLAERSIPSRYYNLYEHHISHDGGEGVVEAADAADVRLVVTRYNDFFSDRVGLREYAPSLTRYLGTRFARVLIMGNDETIFLTRRQKPLPDRDIMNVLEHCGQGANQNIRDHLLFSTLYHHPGTQGRSPPVETRCNVVVPEHGQLAVGIGYRRPAVAQTGTSLSGEILAISAAGTEPLIQKTFDVVPARSAVRRPPEEYRFDLSHLANQKVTLLFRTRRRGRVRMQVLDPKGFVMVWEDPRIEVVRDAAERITPRKTD